MDFQLCRQLAPLTSMLFEGQLYIQHASPLLPRYIMNIFSWSVAFYFYFLNTIFWKADVLIFITSFFFFNNFPLAGVFCLLRNIYLNTEKIFSNSFSWSLSFNVKVFELIQVNFCIWYQLMVKVHLFPPTFLPCTLLRFIGRSPVN